MTRKAQPTPLAQMTVVDMWREVAARVSLARSVGPATSLRALRDDLASSRVQAQRRRGVAEAIWKDAAAEVGAGMRTLAPGVFEMRKDGKSTRVIRERVMLNDAVSIEIAEDKRLARRIMTESGIPVPEWCDFDARSARRAYDFLAQQRPPFVLKPATASGGKGITANVRRPGELRQAMLTATRWGSQLMLERQAEGEVYRVLVLDGQVIDVVCRFSPRLMGDGTSTIRELLRTENRRRLADPSSFTGLPVDLDCLLTLKTQGLELRSVPIRGATVIVRTVTNQNAETENETVDHPIGEKLRAEAASAAEAFGLRLAALDIVTHDLQSTLQESGGVVLEVNAVPALYHHYRVADRSRARRVAVPILRALLE